MQHLSQESFLFSPHITENSRVLLRWTALGLQHTQNTELPVLRGLSTQQATQHTKVRAEPNKLVSQYSLKSSLPGPQFQNKSN